MSTATVTQTGPAESDIQAIIRGAHGNPFAVLGMHGGDGQPLVVNVFAPGAATVKVLERKRGREVAELTRIHPEGFFSGEMPKKKRFEYKLAFTAGEHSWNADDPYGFGPVLGELDEYLLGEGKHLQLYNALGAHPREHEGVQGISFCVWAPNARRVSVVGEFNAWDGRRHPMRRRMGVGLWELFIPGIERGVHYKYEIVGVHGDLMPLKADPLGFAQEQPPGNASIACGLPRHEWRDQKWAAQRHDRQAVSAPMSIYEVHLESWRRDADGNMLDYATAAELLVDYVREMGFTHVELLPISEHPFSGSWGYQPVGMFAPTSRFGSPVDFAKFVDRLHEENVGVIVDWVPAHFPSDPHGLHRFDGTALYEHEDPRLGFHKDWNTLIYNFGRNEVANFLQSNAMFWLREYHVDALRVDAVASMLYLDYSREAGEWIPNRYGGNENLDAIAFLRDTNERISELGDGGLTIAEESTAWPQVSRPVGDGGLGFGYKWNMGWMHDSLEYMKQDPIHRRYHHSEFTFSIHYGFSENFVLPLSHDEVVHGKGSLLGKMPGDRWQKFANLRAYFGYMWTHPGKKLLFMGGEFGQEREWNHDQQLDWHLLQDHHHSGLKDLVRDLNFLYRSRPALHELDCDPAGFEWIESNDHENSVFSYLRHGRTSDKPALIVCNMTPVVRQDYRVGVPSTGAWNEILNTDLEQYGGSNVRNDRVEAEPLGCHGRPASLRLTLPPLATIILEPAE